MQGDAQLKIDIPVLLVPQDIAADYFSKPGVFLKMAAFQVPQQSLINAFQMKFHPVPETILVEFQKMLQQWPDELTAKISMELQVAVNDNVMRYVDDQIDTLFSNKIQCIDGVCG